MSADGSVKDYAESGVLVVGGTSGPDSRRRANWSTPA
jgi:hypothetical protein